MKIPVDKELRRHLRAKEKAKRKEEGWLEEESFEKENDHKVGVVSAKKRRGAGLTFIKYMRNRIRRMKERAITVVFPQWSQSQ
jgi:hypothetical protein